VSVSSVLEYVSRHDFSMYSELILIDYSYWSTKV